MSQEPTAALAEFAASLAYEAIPEHVRHYCKDLLLDALACAAIARRLHAGVAQSFPKSPGRDAFGLPVAIWA